MNSSVSAASAEQDRRAPPTSVPIPGIPSRSRPVTTARAIAAVPPEVSASDSTMPRPRPTSTSRSPELGLDEVLLGDLAGPHQLHAGAQVADPAEPGVRDTEQRDHPDAAAVVDHRLHRLGQRVAERARHVLADHVLQPVLQVGVVGQHEAGDGGTEQDEREDREKAEVGDGGGDVVTVGVLVLLVRPDQVVEPRPPRRCRRSIPVTRSFRPAMSAPPEREVLPRHPYPARFLLEHA